MAFSRPNRVSAEAKAITPPRSLIGLQRGLVALHKPPIKRIKQAPEEPVELVQVVPDAHQRKLPPHLRQSVQRESPKPQIRLHIADGRLDRLASTLEPGARSGLLQATRHLLGERLLLVSVDLTQPQHIESAWREQTKHPEAR